MSTRARVRVYVCVYVLMRVRVHITWHRNRIQTRELVLTIFYFNSIESCGCG